MKKHRGISLLELMLTIAIIVTMVIAATRFYQVTKQNAQTQNALTMIHEVVDASYKWYESNPNFSSISFSQLVDDGLLPAKYKDDTRFNPWGGEIGIGPADNTDKFYITMGSVPDSSCDMLRQRLNSYSSTCQSGVLRVEF